MAIEITESREVEPLIQETKRSEDVLKWKVFLWLRSHPLDAKKGKKGKLRKIASDLGLNYKEAKGTLEQYSHDFLTELHFGVAPKSPTFHRVIVGAYVPTCLDRRRFPEVEEQAVKAGWKFSRNRNKEMVWENDKAWGRVRWFKTGKVLAHIRKPQTEERKRMLLASAFGMTSLILDRAILVSFIQSFDLVAWHEVHENPTGAPLPYMVIDTLTELVGVRTKVGDLSHRSAVEHEVVRPKWIEKQQQAFDYMRKVLETEGQVFQQFNRLMVDLASPRPPLKVDRSVV